MSGGALLLAGAFAISFAPVLVKLLVESHLGLTAIAFWRVLLAGLALGALVLLRGGRLKPASPAGRWALFAGLCFAADLFVWHKSIVLCGAGMATLLGNTQVLWAALFGRHLLGERLGARYLAGSLLSLGGVVLLVGIGSSIDFSPEYLAGIGYGLATGAAYSGYILGLRQASVVWMRAEGSAATGQTTPTFGRVLSVLSCTLLLAALALAPIALTEPQQYVPSSATTVAYLLLLAIGVQMVGWIAISSALPRVPAARGSLILLLQPALATGWGALFFGETLTLLQLLGAALTLAGIYFGSRS